MWKPTFLMVFGLLGNMLHPSEAFFPANFWDISKQLRRPRYLRTLGVPKVSNGLWVNLATKIKKNGAKQPKKPRDWIVWRLSHPKIQQPSINFHGMDTRLQPNHTTCLCASSPKQILFTQPMTVATICSDNHFQSLFTLITAQNPHKNIAQLQRLRWKLPLRLEVRKSPKWSPKDPWEWYIYLLIYHKKQQNVGKYTIHGS